MLGVVNEVPLPNDEPPVEAAYQLMVPEKAVAPSVTVPVPQREAEVAPVIAGPLAEMFAITGLLSLLQVLELANCMLGLYL